VEKIWQLPDDVITHAGDGVFNINLLKAKLKFSVGEIVTFYKNGVSESILVTEVNKDVAVGIVGNLWSREVILSLMKCGYESEFGEDVERRILEVKPRPLVYPESEEMEKFFISLM